MLGAWLGSWRIEAFARIGHSPLHHLRRRNLVVGARRLRKRRDPIPMSPLKLDAGDLSPVSMGANLPQLLEEGIPPLLGE